jgi:hypothetical protein
MMNNLAVDNLITKPIFRNHKTQVIVGITKRVGSINESLYWQKMSSTTRKPIHMCSLETALKKAGCTNLDELERML